jgi:hypothetical protein
MTERREPSEQPAESVFEAPQATSAPETTGGAGDSEEVSRPGELRTPAADKREDVRAKLASRFSYLFMFVVVALLASAVYGGEQWARVQEYSQIIVGAVTGVVRAIIGFYFGSQR